jgi:hypothetical protein
VVVPVVIEEVGVESNATLLVKLVPEGIDAIESSLLVVGVEVAQVIPGVVMQEGAIRVGARSM